MSSKLVVRLRGLLQGFLVVPGAILVAFAAAALVTVEIDRSAGEEAFGWAFGGQASAAREVLSVIAGSLITVAGIAFSITVVTLQLVSSQYTPRAVRGLIEDRTNQVVAGVFLGVFVYCLLVLRTVRDAQEDVEGAAFVPALAVTLGIVLGVIGFALVLVFVHHMAQSIKVSNIAADLAAATAKSIDRLYPSGYGEPADEDPDAVLERLRNRAVDVRAPRSGYIQAIALDSLAEALSERGEAFVPVRVGDFVHDHDVLVRASAVDEDDDGRIDKLRDAFSLANERDLYQDASYGIRQLVDIAMRALSPSLNDPTTALNCIRHLESLLSRLATRELPARARSFADDSTTVVVARRGFSDYLEEAFLELAREAADDVRVLVGLLDALDSVAAAARECGADDRTRLAVEAGEAAASLALEEARLERERELVRERVATLRDRLR